jgi:hypothetical protein
MNKFFENLSRQAEDNPVMAMAVGAALLTALAKVIKAQGDSAGSRAYARQVNYKINHPKR